MNILDKIFEAKKAEVERLKSQRPLSDVQAEARDAEPVRWFQHAIESAEKPVALIAEVKKASPAKGLIREAFDPVEIAEAYEEAGAHCLSVLTDVEFFQGSANNLKLARNATRLPVLRKDFIVDEYQIYEARAMNADAILLIVNGLDDVQLSEYRELAEEMAMDVLVEAHTFEEAQRAITSGATLVGINNRDLTSFETKIEISEEIIPRIKKAATIVSESALQGEADVARVQAAGARAVLIGTAFCKETDIRSKVREVMGW